MSSQRRRLERNIIRNKCYKRDGNIKGFKDEFDTRKVVKSRNETSNTKHNNNGVGSKIKSFLSNIRRKK